MPTITHHSPTFGIELEFVYPQTITASTIAAKLTEAGVATTVEMYNHRTGFNWKLVTDGSLHAGPRQSTIELVSPKLSDEAGLIKVATACRVLGELHCTVNRTCGLHVHIGIDRYNDHVNFFKRLYRLVKAYNPLVEQVFSPSRRAGANSYCHDFRSVRDDQINAARSVSDVINLLCGVSPHDRHYKINLNAYRRHHTVEFRQHQGTVDGQKATMWIRLCLRIIAEASKAPSSTAAPLDAPRRLRPTSKLAIIVGLLQRPEGCTTADALAATGWPAISFPQQARAARIGLRKERRLGVTRYYAAPLMPVATAEDQPIAPVATLEAMLDQLGATEDERTFFISRREHFKQLEEAGDI